ncbi:uncharacterized protein LOC114518936 [Dendronephthya gigantea]|uniref:uncharacterized protein LOC114518936 n=1 Tax=Dendronephthya gigantea TaxID=151771 RepID=UPI00106BABFD|nr:uncharacterized protein LOC114518936 [Dendronephthya gigantea]
MSDIPVINSVLKWKLGIQAPSLAYAARANSRQVICAVDIPYQLIKLWQEYMVAKKVKAQANEAGTNGNEEGCPSHDYSLDYVDLFELSIPGNAFAITNDPTTRNEVNESLRIITAAVKSTYSKAKGGRKKMELDSKVRRFHILEGMTTSVKDLQRENEIIIDELKKWKEEYNNLKEEKEKLYSEMLITLKEKDEEIIKLYKTNKELENYIDCLEKKQSFQNQGKDVSQVAKKSRTLNTFMSRAKIALWFMKSFGLELKELTVIEQKTGKTHPLHVDDCKKFDSLSNEDNEKIEQVLFLLDKFCVGDSFYHELSMITDGLPKSYLVKQRRSQLNDISNVIPTTGKADGAQMSFTDMLKTRIGEFVKVHNEVDWSKEKIQVKISGDGAKMTRNSSFILLSFSLLQSRKDVMSASGNHTFAVIKGSENYETLKDSFGTIFQTINNLIEVSEIEINSSKFGLEFFLGGDYKFLLIVLGMKSATSNFACLWCKVHKENRWQMDKDLDYYNSAPLKRTLEEVITMANKKGAKDKFSCDNEPLIKIDLDHVVLDELHLLLRVMDVLLNNIIQETIAWDKKTNFNKKKCERDMAHLKKLQSTIRSCGVSFDIWEKKTEDGKGSGQYDFTSLLGSDKKKLLAELPDKLVDCLMPETCDVVTEIWKKFHELYKIITTDKTSTDSPGNYFQMAREWINLFTSLRTTSIHSGYKRAAVTPYMHSLVYHVPRFMQLYQSVKIFTGQGVEKNNDVARSVVLCKSNKKNPASDVLQLEFRQWELRDSERAKRPYRKSNTDYWETEIKNKRRKDT